jgi:hypothetical protein
LTPSATSTPPAAVHAYVSAYVITAKILHKVGESRLAALAADRAATMASRPGAAGVDRGLAAREVVGGFLYTGQVAAAEALAVDMACSLEADPDAESPDLLSLQGSLLLLAAVIAARRTDRPVALSRLHRAEDLAVRLGYDGNHAGPRSGRPTSRSTPYPSPPNSATQVRHCGCPNRSTRPTSRPDWSAAEPSCISTSPGPTPSIAATPRPPCNCWRPNRSPRSSSGFTPLSATRSANCWGGAGPTPASCTTSPSAPASCPETEATMTTAHDHEPESGAARELGYVALVVTGAPLAGRTLSVYRTLRSGGWRTTVCPTAAACEWMTDASVFDLLDGRIRPDAVICCPATFNTLNKWAAGINDRPVLGVLHDAVGLGTPILAMPMVAERLARHPVWTATLDFLAVAGVDLLDPASGRITSTPGGIPSGTGDHIADAFDTDLLLRWLATLTGQPT